MTAGPAQVPADAGLALRPPEAVMRLERMGSFHPTRLSFMRVLLRRIAREGWAIERERFEALAAMRLAVRWREFPAGQPQPVVFAGSVSIDDPPRQNRQALFEVVAGHLAEVEPLAAHVGASKLLRQ